jgi:hypothetical protein
MAQLYHGARNRLALSRIYDKMRRSFRTGRLTKYP